MIARSLQINTALAGLAVICLTALGANSAWSNEVGFYGGLTVANFGGDSDEFRLALESGLEDEFGGDWDSSSGSRTGPAVGGFVAFPIHRVLMFQPEFHYVPRGTEYSFSGIVSGYGLDVDGVVKAAYLEFPLLFRLTPAVGSTVRPVFLFGPSLGVNLTGTFEVSAGTVESSVESSVDVPMESVSFGLVLGGGIDVAVSRAASLLVEGRYTLGLTNLADDPDISLPGREFAVLAGMSFHIPKRSTVEEDVSP
jgi:hypothetical protein